MFLTKSSCPGTSTRPTWIGVDETGDISSRWAKPRSIVMTSCLLLGQSIGIGAGERL
jgi:hypothetical protein